MQHSDAGAWEVGVLPPSGSHPQREVPQLAVASDIAYFELKDEGFLPKSSFKAELLIK